MDKFEKLIKDYLKSDSGLSRGDRTPDCPDEAVLIEYLTGAPAAEKKSEVERHVANCGFCLSQLSIASQSKGSFPPVSKELIKKTKSRLGISENAKKRKMQKRLSLIGAIISFILSFFFPKYFFQFLVATLILGMRWAFESEGGRTLIMVLDSWRHHSQDKDDQISRRLKERL